MKKILSGMVYQFVKSFEIWALTILLVIISVFFTFNDLRFLDFIRADAFGETVTYNEDDPELDTWTISPDTISQYHFKGSGLKASDVYRMRVEVLPDGVYDEIAKNRYCIPQDEARTLTDEVISLYTIPAFLIIIFIPIFFGRLFSDGTIKNLLMCGSSKTQIFLASLIFTAVLDVLLFVIRLLILVLMCVVMRWEPPIYMPVLVPYALLSLLILFTATTVTLSALFISNKKTIAFIVGALMIFSILIPPSRIAVEMLWEIEYTNQKSIIENSEYINLIKEKGPGCLAEKFDFNKFNSDFYYDGKLILECGKAEDVPTPTRLILLAIIYGSPSLVENQGDSFFAYLNVRDGLVYVSMGVNAVWIIVSAGLGIIVFRKREIHS